MPLPADRDASECDAESLQLVGSQPLIPPAAASLSTQADAPTRADMEDDNIGAPLQKRVKVSIEATMPGDERLASICDKPADSVAMEVAAGSSSGAVDSETSILSLLDLGICNTTHDPISDAALEAAIQSLHDIHGTVTPVPVSPVCGSDRCCEIYIYIYICFSCCLRFLH